MTLSKHNNIYTKNIEIGILNAGNIILVNSGNRGFRKGGVGRDSQHDISRALYNNKIFEDMRHRTHTQAHTQGF